MEMREQHVPKVFVFVLRNPWNFFELAIELVIVSPTLLTSTGPLLFLRKILLPAGVPGLKLAVKGLSVQTSGTMLGAFAAAELAPAMIRFGFSSFQSK